MGIGDAFRLRGPAQATTRNEVTPRKESFPNADKYGHLDNTPIRLFRLRIIAMGVLVSMGGLIFGFDTGQISGFLEMHNFLMRFHNEGTSGNPSSQNYWSFSNAREGTIVGLLSIGTLVGAICAAPIANALGRRLCIVVLNVIFIIGVIVQITTEYKWYQLAIGRLVAGLGVGGLSVLTPMYQSETAPRQIRGALVSTYQLFITFGIFLAYCINYGTEARQNADSWRIPMGVGFIFPVIMAVGIMFLRESPRWDYRTGRIDRARTTIALSYGVSETHREVAREMHEIKLKFEAEGKGVPWHEVFTGPRMAYRTILGMTLMMLQQLTGANYFFYFGTTIFRSVGLSNSYVTSMILGGVNFGSTFLGLWVVEHFGRRGSLIWGGLAMFVCLMIFASVGHFVSTPSGNTDQTAGNVMIVFACLFIFSYAITWGPIIWALVSEIYPTRYRAQSMGIATASNWTWNFLLSFFTSYISSAIEFQYGYVFAACCFSGAVIVYLFVIESQGRTLEEIDTMYVMHVTPWKSKHWVQPTEETLGVDEGSYATSGEGDVEKTRTPDEDKPAAVQMENGKETNGHA